MLNDKPNDKPNDKSNDRPNDNAFLNPMPDRKSANRSGLAAPHVPHALDAPHVPHALHAPYVLDVHAPLQIAGLTVAYDRRPVLWDINYTAPAGKLIAIVGPNGAGKSTLLKSAIGLTPSLTGQVRIFGETAPRKRGQTGSGQTGRGQTGRGKDPRRRIAYVPQRSAVDWDFPASALDVTVMGLYGRIGWLRGVRRRHRETALAALDAVGLADFADRQIGRLSGGQQQRVFIARALVQDADLYMLDEPLAGVDAATETRIIDILHALRDRGRTVLAVHHDLATIADYFDEIMLLNARLVAAGPVATSFTDAALAETYGNRLDGLAAMAGDD